MKPLPSHCAKRVLSIRSGLQRQYSSHPRLFQRRQQFTTTQDSHLPRIAQPSLWASIVPKSLRNRSRSSDRKKPTNPATYFIWIYLLIGSQAIRIMRVKNEQDDLRRKAELKLDKLREVLEKLHRGEEVDVEKVLGTGDEEQEREWEEALRALQEEDSLWQNNKKKTREEQDRMAVEEQDANPINSAQDKIEPVAQQPPSSNPVPPRRPGFF